jgi:YVTN family beta-propeller protein
MKQFKLNYILIVLTVASVLSSCRKDKDNVPEEQEIVPVRKGLYILSEGIMNANNSALTYYDYDTKVTTANRFLDVNGRGLGDTGSDVQVYGSKMYIVVNVSNTVEVVNANTAKSIKQLEFKDGATGRQPRYVVFNKNKAFVSSYDGTVAVIDTGSLAIEKYIKVGRNPERMAIANGKLYVANSGGLDFPNYDNTVSVIDLNTLVETKKITVTANPRGVYADKYGDIYVLSTGNYGDVAPAMAIIDSKSDAVTKTVNNFSAGSMAINGDIAYLVTGFDGTVSTFNVKTETAVAGSFITDNTAITIGYGVNVDTTTGEVFILNATSYSTQGTMICFDSTGKKKYELKAGVLPNSVAFINK